MTIDYCTPKSPTPKPKPSGWLIVSYVAAGFCTVGFVLACQFAWLSAEHPGHYLYRPLLLSLFWPVTGLAFVGAALAIAGVVSARRVGVSSFVAVVWHGIMLVGMIVFAAIDRLPVW